MKKINIRAIFTCAVSCFLMFSCRSYRELKYLSKCEFQLESIRRVEIAGVQLGAAASIKSFDFNEIRKLTIALRQPEIPVMFRVNLDVKNPNQKTAAINRIEWIFFLEEIELAKGVIDKRVQIEPGGNNIIPIDVEMDLKKVLEKNSVGAITSFIANLMKMGTEESNLKMKIKPTLRIGQKTVSFGRFITVKTKVKSND